MKRIEWVYSVKGLAIVLVVLGHMIRGFQSAGLYEEYWKIFSYIDFTIYSFHMQLFFIISGFLYGVKNRKIGSYYEYLKFIKNKFSKLMIPYLFFSWLQLTIKLIMSGSVNNDLSLRNYITILYEPIEQFWFLYALFIVFGISGFLEFKVKNNRSKLLLVSVLFIIGQIFTANMGIIGIALKNIIYFYLGLNLLRFINLFKENSKIVCSSLLLYIFLKVCLISNIINNMIINSLLSIALAIVASLIIVYLLVFLNKKNKLSYINLIGKYSFPIYLLHTIFGAGVRIVLIKLGVFNIVIQSIVGMLFGIVMPIISYFVYKKTYYNFYKLHKLHKLHKFK